MASKAAKTTKATTKPVAKGILKGGAKGVKGPFAQPRKAAPPKTKPDHMTEEEWTEDKTRCQISTQGRNDRRKKAAVKQSEAQRSASAVAHIAAMSSGNYLPGSQSSSTSRHSASPSPGTFFAQDMASQTPLSRVSSDWADGDPHGGFNPNAMFGVHQRATSTSTGPTQGRRQCLCVGDLLSLASASTPPSGPASGTASAPTPPLGEQQQHDDADDNVVQVDAPAA